MKSFATLAFAATAFAQVITDRCGVDVNRDTSNQTPDVKPIADGLLLINSTTGALDDAIIAFDGTQASIDAVLAGANTVLSTVTTVDNTVKGLAPITDDNALNALNLTTYVADLACTVNKTVDDFTDRKTAVVNACQGIVALQQLQGLLAGSTSLINDVVNVINDGPIGLKSLAASLAQPILDSLNQGISIYADQTTLPATCSSTSSSSSTTVTSTVTSTSSGVVVTVTSTSTGAVGTGYPQSTLSSKPVQYGNSTSAAKSTYGPGYGASSQPAKSTYPAGGNGGNGGGGASSYPASHPSSSSYVVIHPSSSSYVVIHPSSSSYAASHPAVTTSYAAGGNGGNGGSTPAKPTTSAGYPAGTVPYTGAGVTYTAGGFTALFAALAAIAMF